MPEEPGPYPLQYTKPLAYHRVAIAKIVTADCDACGKLDVQCLSVDTSDEEYGSIAICYSCCFRLFTTPAPIPGDSHAEERVHSNPSP
jgi:hypothetical protein